MVTTTAMMMRWRVFVFVVAALLFLVSSMGQGVEEAVITPDTVPEGMADATVQDPAGDVDAVVDVDPVANTDISTQTTNESSEVVDGYVWPKLYDAIDDMLDTSLLIYAIATVRDIARNPSSHFIDAEAFLELPITGKEIFRILAENEENLNVALEKLTAVKLIVSTMFERQKRLGKQQKANATAVASTLLHFSDTKGEEKDLVYAIGVDHRQKRVTVCFRGTVSNNDILADLNFVMARIDNPLANITGQPKKIRFHAGFYHYLFKEIVHEDPTIKTKCDLIIQEAVAALHAHPGYKLYVTGHSLGGALAALFSFHAAAMPDDVIPKPVIGISIASPYVGGSNWKKAHQYLESKGVLQYFRIANHKDYVTIAPPFALNFGLYKHVGMEIKLFRNDKMEMLYSRGNFWKRLARNSFFLNLNIQPVTNHGTREYDTRLEAVQKNLTSIPLLKAIPDAVEQLLKQRNESE